MAAAFALTPAQHVDVVLNFNNKVHRTIYNGAIAPLPIDPFDCVQSQLMDFMAAITKKARDYGWSERIMLIPKTLPEGQDTEYLSMLTQHAQIPIDLIREYELSYVQNQTRERQDSFCLYTLVPPSRASSFGNIQTTNFKLHIIFFSKIISYQSYISQ